MASTNRAKATGKIQDDDSVRVVSIPVEDAASHDLIKQIHAHLVAMEKGGYCVVDIGPINDLRGATRQIIIAGMKNPDCSP